MIIKAKPLPRKVLIACGRFLTLFFKWRFNKIKIYETEILKGHSYIVMCNHFSFWDGFWAGYIVFKAMLTKEPNLKGLYIMSLKKQLIKHPWLSRFGSFSVEPGTTSVEESLTYAAEILNTPGNVFLFFPQAMLESNHVRQIEMRTGIADIMKKVSGNCQLVWSSNLVEYFESLKPSVHCHMLNCGTNHEFNFDEFKTKVNEHHRASIQKQIRYTQENF